LLPLSPGPSNGDQTYVMDDLLRTANLTIFDLAVEDIA
jgi:hypothetical protein